jgi:hypothetical protein
MRILRVIATVLGASALASAALALGEVSAMGVPQAHSSHVYPSPAEVHPSENAEGHTQ